MSNRLASILRTLLLLGAFLSCGRSPSRPGAAARRVDSSRADETGIGVPNRATPKRNELQGMVLDSGIDTVGISERLESDAGLTTDEVDKLFQIVFGDKAKHSGEDLRLIAFVEAHLDSDRPQFPRPRRFLVEREPEGWAVTVMGLEALKHLGGGSSIIVHVVKVNGAFRVSRLTSKL